MKDEHILVDSHCTKKKNGKVTAIVTGESTATGYDTYVAMLEGIFRFLYERYEEAFVEASEHFMQSLLKGADHEHDKMDDV